MTEAQQDTEVTKRHRAPTRLTVVTNSELQTFRDCPKKHGFAYSEGLRPKTTPKALSFGSAFHAGVETLYRTIGMVPSDEVEAIAHELGQKAIHDRFLQWVNECENDPLVSIDSLYEDAKEAIDTATWMFTHYVDTFRADITRIVPLGVELPFAVPLRNTRGRTLPSLVHSGVLDLVAFDPEHGDLVFYDHKTTSTEISSIDKRVEMDPQMGGYLNALLEFLRFNPEVLIEAAKLRTHHPRMAEAVAALESRDATVGRVSYNVVRKKRPRAPKVNQDGTVSVAAIDTLPGFFESALADQATRGKPVTEKQHEMLRALVAKGDTFIGRREFFRSKTDVETWRAETFQQARMIREAEKDPALRYRNPGHCSMPWSMSCSYRSICLDDSPELRLGFTTSPRHGEVEEARKRAQAENEED